MSVLFTIGPAKTKPFWWIQVCGPGNTCDYDKVIETLWYRQDIVKNLLRYGHAQYGEKWILIKRGDKVHLYEIERRI